MQEYDDIGLQCEVKSNNGYGRISLGKLGTKFNVNDVVYVLTESEYQSVMKQSNNDVMTNEAESEKQIDEKLENLLEISLKPINETHDKTLADKDNKINQLQMELDSLKKVCSQFNTKISQLSALDILFRKKHIDLIDDFENSIWITSEDKQIVNADVKQITTKDD